jgi:hypothetical protein
LVRLVLEKYCCYDESMETQKYAEHECAGGRLYYRDALPILELGSLNDRECGHAHGYLVAPGIRSLAIDVRMLQRLEALFSLTRRFVSWCTSERFCAAEQVPMSSVQTRAYLRAHLPPHMLSDIEGVAAGYATYYRQQRSRRLDRARSSVGFMKVLHRLQYWWFTRRLVTVDVDALLDMHMVPDSKHFSAACTSLLAPDDVDADGQQSGAGDPPAVRRGTILGRTLDWALGRGGARTICIVYRARGFASLSFPGNCSVLSGWNTKRLVLLMHVCPPPADWRSRPLERFIDTNSEGKTERRERPPIRLPAAFYNRLLLENSATVADVLQRAEQRRDYVPLGPYHVVTTDREGDGAILSFYQAAKNTVEQPHHTQRLSPGATRPLMVLNFTMPAAVVGSFHSVERRAFLERVFSEPLNGLVNAQRIHDAFRLSPLINSPITLQYMMFQPARGLLSVSWNNGFAASCAPLHLHMDRVFAHAPAANLRSTHAPTASADI